MFMWSFGALESWCISGFYREHCPAVVFLQRPHTHRGFKTHSLDLLLKVSQYRVVSSALNPGIASFMPTS